MKTTITCIHISGKGGAWCVGDLRRLGVVPHTIPVHDPILEGGVNFRTEDWQPISVVDLVTTAQVNEMTYEGVSQDGTAHILTPK